MSWYPSVKIDAGGSPVVSQAGAGLLLRTVEATGLTGVLSEKLSPWRRPGAVHDPGKVVSDLAVMLALGGDCVSDLALLRAEPGLFGAVASDPTVSRLITVLAADERKVLAGIGSARAQARARAWKLAGTRAPDHGIDTAAPVVIDLDATLIDAHSEKQQAAPTFKRGYGFHPLWAFIDHGETGTGEPAAVMLRPGNAGSNTAHDHKQVLADALAQLPHLTQWRAGRSVLIRADSGGRHPRVPRLLPLPPRSVFGRVRPHRRYRRRLRRYRSRRLGAGGRCRRGNPARCLGRRGRWTGGSVGLAARDAAGGAQGTPAPGCAVAVHRPRRAPVDRVRYQHALRGAAGVGVAAPPPRSLRGPDPQREGHRRPQSAVPFLRCQPDLARRRRARLGPDGLDANAGHDRASRTPMGSKNTTDTLILDPGTAGSPCPPTPSAATRSPPVG